jgi:hypothetical protein
MQFTISSKLAEILNKNKLPKEVESNTELPRPAKVRNSYHIPVLPPEILSFQEQQIKYTGPRKGVERIVVAKAGGTIFKITLLRNFSGVNAAYWSEGSIKASKYIYGISITGTEASIKKMLSEPNIYDYIGWDTEEQVLIKRTKYFRLIKLVTAEDLNSIDFHRVNKAVDQREPKTREQIRLIADRVLYTPTNSYRDTDLKLICDQEDDLIRLEPFNAYKPHDTGELDFLLPNMTNGSWRLSHKACEQINDLIAEYSPNTARLELSDFDKYDTHKWGSVDRFYVERLTKYVGASFFTFRKSKLTLENLLLLKTNELARYYNSYETKGYNPITLEWVEKSYYPTVNNLNFDLHFHYANSTILQTLPKLTKEFQNKRIRAITVECCKRINSQYEQVLQSIDPISRKAILVSRDTLLNRINSSRNNLKCLFTTNLYKLRYEYECLGKLCMTFDHLRWMWPSAPIDTIANILEIFHHNYFKNTQQILAFQGTTSCLDQSSYSWLQSNMTIESFQHILTAIYADSTGDALREWTDTLGLLNTCTQNKDCEVKKPKRWRIPDLHDYLMELSWSIKGPGEPLPKDLLAEDIEITSKTGSKWVFRQPDCSNYLGWWAGIVRNCLGGSSYTKNIKERQIYIILCLIDGRPSISANLCLQNSNLVVREVRLPSNKSLPPEIQKEFEQHFSKVLETITEKLVGDK